MEDAISYSSILSVYADLWYLSVYYVDSAEIKSINQSKTLVLLGNIIGLTVWVRAFSQNYLHACVIENGSAQKAWKLAKRSCEISQYGKLFKAIFAIFHNTHWTKT